MPDVFWFIGESAYSDLSENLGYEPKIADINNLILNDSLKLKALIDKLEYKISDPEALKTYHKHKSEMYSIFEDGRVAKNISFLGHMFALSKVNIEPELDEIMEYLACLELLDDVLISLESRVEDPHWLCETLSELKDISFYYFDKNKQKTDLEISRRARGAAAAKHSESRSVKGEVIALYITEAPFKSRKSAAELLHKRVASMFKVDTVYTWLSDYDKSKK